MSLFRRINLSIRSLVHQIGIFDLKLFLKVHFKRMQMKIHFFYWIIYFKILSKGHLPNLLFLVSLRSKDVSPGSSESPGSGSEMVTMVPPWQFQICLLSGVGSDISAGKNTLNVLILSSRQPAIWYHQCQEVKVDTLIRVKTLLSDVFSWHTDSRTHANTNKIIFHWI